MDQQRQNLAFTLGEKWMTKERNIALQKKFGASENDAFRNVRNALTELIDLGKQRYPDFREIDKNPLSQLFKAKILSLYFPSKFINICSGNHLEQLAAEFDLPADLATSEYQHLLLHVKKENLVTQNWSNPKFMAFLYDLFLDLKAEKKIGIKKPKRKTHRRVNFDDIQTQWGKIGKAAEEFALDWEKKRLIRNGFGNLISRIVDRRDRPGYGYDFLSHSSKQRERFIEVKSVGKDKKNPGYRFFLSDNERVVSLSTAHKPNYFFYLVFFEGGIPTSVQEMTAKQIYSNSTISPSSYVVHFELDKANPHKI